MSEPTPELPVLTVEQAKRTNEPCEVQVGSAGGYPVMFIHDPERPDRLERMLEDWA